MLLFMVLVFFLSYYTCRKCKDGLQALPEEAHTTIEAIRYKKEVNNSVRMQ